MAASSCVRCGKNIFEMVDVSNIINATHPVTFIQCASCGGVVGAMEPTNISSGIDYLIKAVRGIANKVGVQI